MTTTTNQPCSVSERPRTTVRLGPEEAAGHRLGLSHSTVEHHLANARSKVGATTTQLVWNLAARLPEPEGIAQVEE